MVRSSNVLRDFNRKLLSIIDGRNLGQNLNKQTEHLKKVYLKQLLHEFLHPETSIGNWAAG